MKQMVTEVQVALVMIEEGHSVTRVLYLVILGH